MKKKAPRIVVSALIKKGDKYLLVKERLESGQEMWIVPGGGVDFGENLEEALLREIREELGIDIKITGFVRFQEAIFTQFNYHTIIFFFLAKPSKDNLQLEKQILEAKYFTKEEVKGINLVESALWLLES